MEKKEKEKRGTYNLSSSTDCPESDETVLARNVSPHFHAQYCCHSLQ
jgi:hypothetical protein